jgi:predicted CopG family antitoxin
MSILATKTIRISEEIYEYLSKQGTVTDSFDSVLKKLILNKNKTETISKR